MARTGPAIQTTVRSCPFEGVRRALKTQVLENASTEKASTKQRISQGWKRMYGKRKYESAGMENANTENASTMQTFSQIKKFGTSQVSVVYF